MAAADEMRVKQDKEKRQKREAWAAHAAGKQASISSNDPAVNGGTAASAAVNTGLARDAAASVEPVSPSRESSESDANATSKASDNDEDDGNDVHNLNA